MDIRNYNVGNSNYASLSLQPWDIWISWNLNPWDADIIKRIGRTKPILGFSYRESRIEDYKKIIHDCQERIRQLEQTQKDDNYKDEINECELAIDDLKKKVDFFKNSNI